MSAQYNLCIKVIYFSSGYLFQGIEFAHSIISPVYPIVFFFFQELKWTGSSGAWMDIILH